MEEDEDVVRHNGNSVVDCSVDSALEDSTLELPSRCRKYVSRLLPNYPNQVFITQRDSGQIPADILRALDGSTNTASCPEIETGRTAIPPMTNIRAIPRRDVSLCNIMGLGSEYVYVPFVKKAYVLSDPLGIPALLLLGVLIIFMMVIMGHNLQMVLGEAVSSAGSRAGGHAHQQCPSNSQGTSQSSGNGLMHQPDAMQRHRPSSDVHFQPLLSRDPSSASPTEPPQSHRHQPPSVANSIFDMGAFAPSSAEPPRKPSPDKALTPSHGQEPVKLKQVGPGEGGLQDSSIHGRGYHVQISDGGRPRQR
jgi:hypothetical protein